MEHLHIHGTAWAIVDANMMFRLSPVGLTRKPESLEELATALQNIAECIISLHSLGYCHCDIRWSNIVWTERGWYLIDCTFATSLSDLARLKEMSSIIKDKYVFDRTLPWSPRHDYFQFGRLISESNLVSNSPFIELRNYLYDLTVPEVDVRYIRSTLGLKEA
jgi:hypothetical protein